MANVGPFFTQTLFEGGSISTIYAKLNQTFFFLETD